MSDHKFFNPKISAGYTHQRGIDKINSTFQSPLAVDIGFHLKFSPNISLTTSFTYEGSNLLGINSGFDIYTSLQGKTGLLVKLK